MELIIKFDETALKAIRNLTDSIQNATLIALGDPATIPAKIEEKPVQKKVESVKTEKAKPQKEETVVDVEALKLKAKREVMKLVKAGKREELKDVLAQFGVEKISEIADDRLESCIEALEAL
ncbi:hypothetical protein B7939_01110 [Eggerthia catenaformis]|nr:hypothetical protein B7939_01110 [Eggerthia catenaformis]